ncbi:MAG: type transporter [Clostridiales bacterium]|nr:type transporter [Clostridiales bacterium]
MKQLRVVWYTLRLQMKNSFVRPMFRFCLIANPIVNTILLYEMFKNSNQDNFTTYIMLGAGLMGLWSCICFSSAGDINRERFSGTLSLIFAAPVNFGMIIFGKVLGNTILSLVTLIISFLTAKILYHAPIMIESPGYLLLSLLATVICFIAISICIAYLLTLSRKTQLYMNCIEIPIIFVCGFVFPVDILPNWVLPISYSLSPTWAVKLIRMSVSGVESKTDYFIAFGILVCITVGYLLMARFLYRLIERQVRIKATLEVS